MTKEKLIEKIREILKTDLDMSYLSVLEQEELETGLESLANKYGLDRIMDTVARMSIKD